MSYLLVNVHIKITVFFELSVVFCVKFYFYYQYIIIKLFHCKSSALR
jgi:hypothetical protein